MGKTEEKKKVPRKRSVGLKSTTRPTLTRNVFHPLCSRESPTHSERKRRKLTCSEHRY